MKLVGECFRGSHRWSKIASRAGSHSPPPAHASASEQTEVEYDGNKDEYQALSRHSARIHSLQIGVDDEGQRKKHESQKRNDDRLVDTVEESCEKPEQDDGDSREGNCQQGEETRHNSAACIFPSLAARSCTWTNQG